MSARATIRIFSMVGCGFCAKAKERVRSEQLDYTEIDLELYPRHYADAAKATAVATVPLVFFGSRFVGGNDGVQSIPPGDLLTELEKETDANLPSYLTLTDDDHKAAAALIQQKEDAKANYRKINDLVTFETEVGTLKYNDVHQLLTIGDWRLDGEGKGQSQRAPPKTKNRGGVFCATAKNSVTGSDVVSFLATSLFPTGGQAAALDLANRLLQLEMYHPADAASEKRSLVAPHASAASAAAADDAVKGHASRTPLTPGGNVTNQDGKDGPPPLPTYQHPYQWVNAKDVFYRLQSIVAAESHTLNTRRIFNPLALGLPPTPRAADVVAAELRQRLGTLLATYMDAEGVDYEEMAKSAAFHEFVDASAELQTVDIRPLDRTELLAFSINTYNMAIIHAYCVKPIPTWLVPRYKFFNNLGYNIGGYHYSFNDLENGIMRANRKGYSLGLSFEEGDPRAALGMVDPVDYRIHFALNCGAKSCPPVKVYQSSTLDEQLQKATAGYLESTVFDEEKNVLKVTQIVSLYKRDFEPDPVVTLLPHLSPSLQPKVRAAHQPPKSPVTLKFFSYDWSVNSKPKKQ